MCIYTFSVRSGRVGLGVVFNLAGQVSSGLKVFKFDEYARVVPRGLQSDESGVGSGQDMPIVLPVRPHQLIRPDDATLDIWTDL